jgi:hypothetical protein
MSCPVLSPTTQIWAPATPATQEIDSNELAPGRRPTGGEITVSAVNDPGPRGNVETIA